MLSEAIEKGENEIVEFKETFRYDINTQSKNKALKKEVTKAICGLLNNQGGMVLIGVSDDCKVNGLSRDLNLYKGESAIKNRDNLLKDINSTCREHLGTRVIILLTISYETVEEEEIILIKISPSDEPVFHEDKVFYVRNGPETIKLERKNLAEYLLKRFGRDQPQKELKSIDMTLRPDDSKIAILEVLIKNFEIQYYAEGYQSSVNSMIYRLLEIINRYRPGYLERFAPNHNVSHQKIISHFFSSKYGKNLFPTIFQKKIRDGEITPEEVPSRDILTRAGDLAYAVYELFNNDGKKENVLIDDVRIEYNHIIQGKHEFFREEYKEDKFNEASSILEENDIIKTTGPYNGSSCKETYNINNLERLNNFISKYSIEKLLGTL